MNQLKVLFLSLVLISFVSCIKKNEGVKTEASATGPKKFNVGLVLDKGGKDDKSFNASAYRGATEAEKKFGVVLKTVESSDDSAVEPSLRTFAQRNFDLIIGIGFVMGDPMKKVASEFPGTKFLLVDAEAPGNNVRSILFQEHEGSFLVGALAAMASTKKFVGFIGGMDIPLIRRFEKGYEAGAKYIDPNTKVQASYVGSSSDSWKNPTKGKELAISQYNQGIDVIFHAAGASGLGVFDAAEELKKYVIGVDSNQNWVKPGRVLTSMLKRIDVAVTSTIQECMEGKFTPGTQHLGFKEGGIDYSLDEFNRSLVTSVMEKKAEEIKKGIVEGKIKVPDYYLMMK